MRFLISFRIPIEKANAAIKEGTLTQTMRSIMEELQPEAAYHTEVDGARGGYLVVNIDDASQLPAIAEPLFFGLGATIKVHPVMTNEDLEKGYPCAGASSAEVRLENHIHLLRGSLVSNVASDPHFHASEFPRTGFAGNWVAENNYFETVS